MDTTPAYTATLLVGPPAPDHTAELEACRQRLLPLAQAAGATMLVVEERVQTHLQTGYVGYGYNLVALREGFLLGASDWLATSLPQAEASLCAALQALAPPLAAAA